MNSAEQIQGLCMNNMPSNLLSQARASEAQFALMEAGVSGRGRPGIGLPILATCMPVILACAVVLSLQQGMDDQTGFVTTTQGHSLVPAERKISESGES